MELYNRGYMQEVIERGEHELARRPQAIALWNILGAAYIGLEFYDDAIRAFKKVTVLAPEFPDGFNNYVLALKRKRLFDEAIASFKKALELNPSYFEALSNIGTVFLEMGLLEKAIKAFKESIAINSSYAKAYNNLGTALYELGSFGKAIAAYESALFIDPNYAEAHNNLGVIHLSGSIRAIETLITPSRYTTQRRTITKARSYMT